MTPQTSDQPAYLTAPTSGLLPAEADVVVIGAGIPAMAAAFYLSQHGVNPVVLAPRADLSDGSTRGIGLVMPGLGEEPARLARALGVDSAQRILQFGQQAIRELEALSATLSFGWTPTAALMLARRAGEAGELAASIGVLEGAGIAVEPVDGAAAAELAGAGFLGGLKVVEAGLLEPLALNLELARMALAAGVGIYLEARDVRVEEGRGRLRVESSRGVIETELVIHAGGVEGASVSPFVRGCILPARVQMLRAECLGEAGALPGTASSGFEYWRWAADGALWLGGFRYLSRELGMVDLEEGLDARVSARQEAVALELCGGVAPSITHRWARLLDISCDGLPLVGSLPGQPRQLVATGFGGLDSSYGLLAAKCVVEELLELPGRLAVPEEFGPRRMV